MTITLTPVFSLFTPSDTQLIDYKPGTGIMKVEGWGNRPDNTMWVTDDESSARTLSSWIEKTTLGGSTISSLPVGMWKKTHNSDNEQPNELVGPSTGELGVGVSPHRGKKVDKSI